jgi:hypothetical protein
MLRPMRRAGPAAFVVLLLCACSGTVPERDAPPERGFAAILIGGRMILPSGESRDGVAPIDFETKTPVGADAETYELPIPAADVAFFRVEPGVYGLAPTRSFFGTSKTELTVRIADREYSTSFPRELMRPSYDAKPRKVVVVGVLETTVLPALPGQKPQVRVRLDDSPKARRELVQSMIRTMMDPSQSNTARDSAVSWSHALQEQLQAVLAEETRRPLYESAP